MTNHDFITAPVRIIDGIARPVRLTKADAERWLDAHVGATIQTIQTDLSDRTTWMPADRTLSKQFATSWLLDGSTVRITPEHTVEAITPDSLKLAWHREDGSVIHVTTYTAV